MNPRNPRKLLTSLGIGHLSILLILAQMIDIPSVEIMWPKDSICLNLKNLFFFYSQLTDEGLILEELYVDRPNGFPYQNYV